MKKSLKSLPDETGYFGKYGGQFVPSELKLLLDEVAKAYEVAKADPNFWSEYYYLLKNYAGRPSPLYYAKNLSQKLKGAKIYLKREDLNHTGSHKINHTIGEALLAKRMGKTKLMAETGAGQHGVALATAAALVGLECEIHMGEVDVVRQHSNVVRMQLLGAKVVTVKTGSRCLKDAVDDVLGTFIKNPEGIFLGTGSTVGPHPFPMIVRDFQKIIGEEVRMQILEQERRIPDYLVACVGGGSNAIGLFNEFLDDAQVKMIAVEAGGKNSEPGNHAATLSLGKPGKIHGMFTYLLQDKNGDPLPVESIAAGLDYPGVGPIFSNLKDEGRIICESINDEEALGAFQVLAKTEGIIPAIESSHAVAHAIKIAPKLGPEQIVVVNISGRGDKDIDFIADRLGLSQDNNAN